MLPDSPRFFQILPDSPRFFKILDGFSMIPVGKIPGRSPPLPPLPPCRPPRILGKNRCSFASHLHIEADWRFLTRKILPEILPGMRGATKMSISSASHLHLICISFACHLHRRGRIAQRHVMFGFVCVSVCDNSLHPPPSTLPLSPPRKKDAQRR